MILLKIAWRNLREHKTKTLIIGSLIALGIAFLVIGNSVMASVTQGLRASFVENFTGDVIVREFSEDDVAFIGGFGAAPPIIGNFAEVKAHVDSLNNVTSSTPILAGAATINQNDASVGFSLVWGIQPSSYRQVFPDSFVVTEGRFLEDGEVGVVLSETVIEDIFAEENVRLEVGDVVLLSGQNNITGTKIREVPIVGIGYFGNAAGLLDSLSLVDANTLRGLTGLTEIRAEETVLEPAPDTTEDSLFGSGSSLFNDAPDTTSDSTTSESAAPADFDNILGDTSVRDQFLSLDNNAWHFLLVDTTSEGAVSSVTASLGGAGVSDTLVFEDWRWGSGPIATVAVGIRNILNIVIVVIAIVAIIIIMNTLVISVTERIAEIGTIRAIGGQKSFVRSMITAEVLTITVLFGVVGIGIGALAIGLLNVIGIPPSNIFFEVLFGGSTLRPVLSLVSVVTSLGVVTIIGLVASLYPTSVALGFSPVRAMQR